MCSNLQVYNRKAALKNLPVSSKSFQVKLANFKNVRINKSLFISYFVCRIYFKIFSRAHPSHCLRRFKAGNTSCGEGHSIIYNDILCVKKQNRIQLLYSYFSVIICRILQLWYREGDLFLHHFYMLLQIFRKRNDFFYLYFYLEPPTKT